MLKKFALAAVSDLMQNFEFYSLDNAPVFAYTVKGFYPKQIWCIGNTLASQAGEAGSTPVICFFDKYFL